MPKHLAETQLVRINWESPVSVTSLKALYAGEGLYQVYGTHVVFGPMSLLYVGKTIDLRQRFDHHEAWLKHEIEVAVRFGRIMDSVSPTLLGDAEKLTIYWHSPPYNSHHIAKYTGAPLRVQNWGDRGRLLPEYSWPWEPLPARPDEKDEA